VPVPFRHGIRCVGTAVPTTQHNTTQHNILQYTEHVTTSHTVIRGCGLWSW